MIARIKTRLDRLRLAREWRRLPADVRDRYRNDEARVLNDDPGIDAAVAATVSWLCTAQRESTTADGGVARHFSVIDGWGPSYPETTGYIVPTLIEHARRGADPDALRAARDMLDWLVEIQLPDGAFQGGTITDRPVSPVTFNTGQILMGLAAGATEFGEPYTAAMHRAATWLADCMDDDGCWRRNQSPFARAGEKTYETHTAWGLIEAARASGESGYGDAALRNIRWALGKQRANGWFDDCCLTDPSQPLTHTIGYAMRGIIEGYLYSGDESLLQAATRSAAGLVRAVGPDGMLPGRLDSGWNGVVSWSCLTGSVQIAHCWLQLYRISGCGEFLEAARAVNRYARRTIDVHGDDDVRGAVRGSFPLHGHYGRLQYLNWAAKFFVDANVLEQSVLEPDR